MPDRKFATKQAAKIAQTNAICVEQDCFSGIVGLLWDFLKGYCETNERVDYRVDYRAPNRNEQCSVSIDFQDTFATVSDLVSDN